MVTYDKDTLPGYIACESIHTLSKETHPSLQDAGNAMVCCDITVEGLRLISTLIPIYISIVVIAEINIICQEFSVVDCFASLPHNRRWMDDFNLLGKAYWTGRDNGNEVNGTCGQDKTSV